MRILSPNTIHVSKDALKEINPSITFLDSDNKNIAGLMSKDNEIEYINGQSFIWRFDITWFPSFNKSFVAKPFQFQPQLNRKESTRQLSHMENIDSVKLNNYTESSVLFTQKQEQCVTNGCRFRHTMKDFVDLINMDESIKTIKDNPSLYNDMLKFSYLNLDAFDFDKIIDSDYLSNKLTEEKIDTKNVDE